MRGFSNPHGTIIKTDEGCDSFIPRLLPPDIDFSGLIPHISEASSLVGTVNGLGKKLSNPHLMVRPQLIREAVLSSRIEGSDVSLSDLYLHQINIKQNEHRLIDSEEVSNCADALEMSLRRVNKGMSLDLNLINECHKVLLHGICGHETHAGSLRQQQNWIGHAYSNIKNAIYVPPPPSKIRNLIGNLFDFMDNPPQNIVPLIQCAISHYQFEAIHPYVDGNGRIGRLLIPLMLADRKLLDIPLLYVSGYIEKHRERYYKLLLDVSAKSEWIEWIRFFLTALIEQSRHAIYLTERLDILHGEYLRRMNVKRLPKTTIKIVDLIFQNPMLTRRRVEDELGVSNLSAKNGIDRLVRLGILRHMGVMGTKNVYVAEDVYNLIDS